MIYIQVADVLLAGGDFGIGSMYRQVGEGKEDKELTSKSHQQLTPHEVRLGPLVFARKGSMRTHNSEKIEARRMDHTMIMVGVRFCLPIKPLRKGYKCTITHKAKKSFPNSGPHD